MSPRGLDPTFPELLAGTSDRSEGIVTSVSGAACQPGRSG